MLSGPIELVSERNARIARLLEADREIANDIDVIEFINGGVSREIIDRVREALGLEHEEMASILSLSQDGFSDHYDANTAERVYKLAELAVYGEELFEDPANLSEWLRAPAKALGYKRPLSLLSSFLGTEMVIRVVVGLEYGVVL